MSEKAGASNKLRHVVLVIFNFQVPFKPPCMIHTVMSFHLHTCSRLTRSAMQPAPKRPWLESRPPVSPTDPTHTGWPVSPWNDIHCQDCTVHDSPTPIVVTEDAGLKCEVTYEIGDVDYSYNTEFWIHYVTSVGRAHGEWLGILTVLHVDSRKLELHALQKLLRFS